MMVPIGTGIFYSVALLVANPDLDITHLRWWVAVAIICLAEPLIMMLKDVFHA